MFKKTLGKILKRKSFLNDAVGSDARERNPFRIAGDNARDLRNWRAAADNYTKYLHQYPDDFDIWVQLGHAEKEAGAFDGAEAAYRQALVLDPNDADLLLNFGSFYRRMGDLETAAEMIRRSFEVDRNRPAGAELERSIFQPYLANAEKHVARTKLRPRAAEVVGPRVRSIGAVDSTHGWTISGWAVDPDAPNEPAEVAFFLDGALIDSCVMHRFRSDIDLLGHGSPLAGFSVDLDLDYGKQKSYTVSARLARSGQELLDSPVIMSAPVEYANWVCRKADTKGDVLELVRRKFASETAGELLSIVMPVYNTPILWLRQALTSVAEQWCENWELICVDDCSPNSDVRDVLDEFSARDSRFRTIRLEVNSGISSATNAGILSAKGNYVAFMDHDDYLEPDAVYRMLQAGQKRPELIYSDEAITGDSIATIQHFVARSAFSYDYYLSHPYFVHFVAVRADVARAVLLDETLKISADVDFVLRVIEKSSNIAHVPSFLYRWRTHKTSTGHARKSEVTAATIGVLKRHLERSGVQANVSPGLGFNNYRIDFHDDRGKTMIVIPTKNRGDLLKACIDSILKTSSTDNVDILVIDHESTDKATCRYLASLNGVATVLPYSGPFNYARMHNYALEHISEDYKYLLFMNNDVEAIDAGWLEHMRGLAGRSDVGVVGATLLYGNLTIQHSGVVMSLGDLVDHAHKFLPFEVDGERNRGYNLSLSSTRDYSAVTGACMMMRRDVFAGIGGFDETFAVGYNDTDLCLRIGSLGLKILNDPYAVLYHHESATRLDTDHMKHPEDAKRLIARWSDMLAAGDPFYNPLLVPRPAEDHSVRKIQDIYAPPRIRAVNPVIKSSSTARPEKFAV
ncbi:GT2 family glycosyltransferase [Sphingomonas sp. PP-F2F-G114-C0414]|uniref:glycosyltransferase n=1 Tax=Sphingomonas sp. PP-F2F-G114-C0414 TaxID=2135662 RepID=UPI000EF8A2AB|nr:glycosyltransferase [Sphingomonas sp. PP-F2F-G114-C0414]RMB25762.1 GT2 family glycosyltransferase [Sphingomonas sp. PP-F2F-G114-C0414]